MDYFNHSAHVMGGAHSMSLPNGSGLNSITNSGLDLQHSQTSAAAAAAMHYASRAHNAYMMGSEAAYMGPKHAAGLPGYQGYPSTLPPHGYPYSLPPGYRTPGLHVDAMKHGYPAVAAAAAQEEYIKQSLLNAGKPGVGPYGMDPARMHAGYYAFPSMQPYGLGGSANKRKLDSAENEDGKRQKTGKPKPHKKKSKYRGVFWHSRGKAWVSSIMVNGKTTHLGYYDCEVEAARVYDKEAIRLKGITCAVNFPDSVDRFGKNQDATTATDNKRSTRHERKRAERISKYRGVCWNKCNSSWKACIKIDGRNKHIGYFASEKDAAKAYDLKARKVRGASAKLNFPDDDNDKDNDKKT